MGHRTTVRPRVAGLTCARAVACAVAFLAAAGIPPSAGAEPPSPSDVGVAAPDAPPDEARYVTRDVPDIAIRTADGEILLSALWREGPLVLTMVFTRCAGICSPYLRALRRADEALDLPDDVRRVVVSFDPRDTPDEMRRTAEHLGVARRRGDSVADRGPHCDSYRDEWPLLGTHDRAWPRGRRNDDRFDGRRKYPRHGVERL